MGSGCEQSVGPDVVGGAPNLASAPPAAQGSPNLASAPEPPEDPPAAQGSGSSANGVDEAASFDAFDALPEASASTLAVPDQALAEGHFVAIEFPSSSIGIDRAGSIRNSLDEAPVQVDLLSFADPLGAVSPGPTHPRQAGGPICGEGFESLI